MKYKGATTDSHSWALAEKWEVNKDGNRLDLHPAERGEVPGRDPLRCRGGGLEFRSLASQHAPPARESDKAGKTFEYNYEAQFGGFDENSLITKVGAPSIRAHGPDHPEYAPQGPLLVNLAMFVFDLVSPTAVEKWGVEFGKYPVGPAPSSSSSGRWGRRWSWRQTRITGTRPACPRSAVVIRNIKDSSQRLAALKAGDIDGFEGLNPDDVKVVRPDPNLQILLRPTNNAGIFGASTTR